MSKAHRLVPARQWRRLRAQIFIRDGYRCRNCGRAGRLECDHVVPLDKGGAALDPDNCQALCRGCHIEKTRRENAANLTLRPDREAWRRYLAESLNVD